jgi:anaerobic selenocysteine-containing dehydrogenase
MKHRPHRRRRAEIKPYGSAAGGWGSLEGMARVAASETPPVLDSVRALARQNKAEGFACVSCAWPKPAKAHPAEFCENGAKATAWDLTRRRCTPAFFASHTLTELLTWSDFELEQTGRLTAPIRYDRASETYVACAWEDAFAAIGQELRALDPKSVVFYASGRASLETSYMYALMARMYGSQNLPDSSNMCHESTSVGLKQSLGSPAGTVRLEDDRGGNRPGDPDAQSQSRLGRLGRRLRPGARRDRSDLSSVVQGLQPALRRSGRISSSR